MNKYLIWWSDGEVKGIAAYDPGISKPEDIEFPGEGSPNVEVVEDHKTEKILDYVMKYVTRGVME